MRFSGVFANLPTALTVEGLRVDRSRMAELVQELVGEGVHGIACLLSSGEFAYLTAPERDVVARTVVAAAGGRVPVLVGVSADTTEATVDLARRAIDAGADAVLVQPRSYAPLTRDEALRHFITIGQAAEGAFGIYNNPATTGFQVDGALYELVVEQTGAVVTKDGSGDIFSAADVVERCGDQLSYLWGTEYSLLPALASGAHGCCLALATVVPAEMLRIHDAVRAGDLETARSRYWQLLPLLRVVKRVGPFRAVKTLADIKGMQLGPHRRPIEPVDNLIREQLAAALRAVEDAQG